MSRQPLTKREYLAELNRQLRSHPAYVEGMRFVPRQASTQRRRRESIGSLPDGVAPPLDLFPMIAAEVHATYSVQADALRHAPATAVTRRPFAGCKRRAMALHSRGSAS
jgi:hypothetical protein